MDVFTMVAVIVVVSCLTSVATTYLKAKRKGSDPKIQQRLDNLEARLANDALEERVRTLEKIVTDDKRRLDNEIRSL